MMRRFLYIFSGILLSQATLAQSDADTIRTLLEKMSHAATHLNYEGRFVYQHADKLDTMHLLHRNGDGIENERLVSLNGINREVLRSNGKVTTLTANQYISHGETESIGIVPGVLLKPDRHIGEHYELKLTGEDRVAGLKTTNISIKPKDDFRYGYNLCLDKRSGLLLKSSLIDNEMRVLEQIMYTSLRFLDEIPELLMKPVLPVNEQPELEEDEDQIKSESIPNSYWNADWLPAGFKLSKKMMHTEANGEKMEQHIYTDGLSSFSVYLEEIQDKNKYLRGLSEIGAMSAFGVKKKTTNITVIGNIPPATVKSVASAYRYDND